MNPRFWGRGYMTEALEALLRFGFGMLSLHRVWAMCNVANRRSVAVLERLGMRREGTLIDHQLIRGEWSSSYLYALLRREHRQR